MYETDNGAAPPAGPGYRLPEDGPLPDLAMYERLIADGIAEADSRGTIVDHVTARRLAIWLAARPKNATSPTAWSASSRPEPSTLTSRTSCANTPAAPTPTSRTPPGC
jgi:hypothetical protein